jgi:DNA-binding NarL/FixJ family response regulator
MIKVLIADDHPVVRKGIIKLLLEENSNFKMDEAETGYEVLSKARNNKYELILLDISLPGMNGLDVLKQLKYENKNIPVLILSFHPEEEYAIRVLKSGASGYLTKGCSPEKLVFAINKILKGGKFISESLAERLAEGLISNTQYPSHEYLSDREYQIMNLIASGKTSREMEKELSISIKTISTYKTRIYKKLKIKNDVQLVHYVFRNRILKN